MGKAVRETGRSSANDQKRERAEYIPVIKRADAVLCLNIKGKCNPLPPNLASPSLSPLPKSISDFEPIIIMMEGSPSVSP